MPDFDNKMGDNMPSENLNELRKMNASDERSSHDTFLFNSVFTAMGFILLGVITWIGMNVSHIPAIEQKIADLNQAFTEGMAEMKSDIRDLDNRVRALERHGHNGDHP